MRYFLFLPIVCATALLTGCAVEPGYVESRPVRVYGGGGPGPGYYEPEPVYGGTTVVAVEQRDRYVVRDRYDRDRRRTSAYRRSGEGEGRGRDRQYRRGGDEQSPRGQRPAQSYGRNGGQRPAAASAPTRKADSRKKKEKRDQS